MSGVGSAATIAPDNGAGVEGIVVPHRHRIRR
jgi:hypothetical protein